MPGRRTHPGRSSRHWATARARWSTSPPTAPRFELSGPRARAVLEKGCSLDLHPRVFKPGTALSTEIGGIPAILWKTADETYRIFPRASFAEFLGRWLLDAMREFASPEVP